MRRFTPHINFTDHYGFEGELQTRFWHVHFFEVFQQNGGRFGAQANVQADRPVAPFTVFAGRDGRRVTIPPGYYDWTEWAAHWASDPSGRVFLSGQVNWGGFYDGDRTQLNVELGAQTEGPLPVQPGIHQERRGATLRRLHDRPRPLQGDVLVHSPPAAPGPRPVQRPDPAALVEHPLRLALAGGTGFFVVFNDIHDTYVSGSRDQVLGRALIIKYTRQFDF